MSSNSVCPDPSQFADEDWGEPGPDDPEPEEPEIPEELQAHWDAADEGDRQYTMEAEAAGDDTDDDGVARRQPASAAEPNLGDLTEVA
jgi:hypothetical protein